MSGEFGRIDKCKSAVHTGFQKGLILNLALYTIGDLHLSLGVNKPMDIFAGWEDYIEKILKNWNETVGDDDVTVIPGDISWSMSLEEARADFEFLNSLKGRKILLKGNHDYWWNTLAKMRKFLCENGFSSIDILHNNYYRYSSCGICATRGWINETEESSDAKVLARESARLETSVASAVADGYEPIVFLHYPPVFLSARNDEIFKVLRKYKIKKCYYGHMHGASHKNAVTGLFDGIHFELVSSDFIKFCPKFVM